MYSDFYEDLKSITKNQFLLESNPRLINANNHIPLKTEYSCDNKERSAEASLLKKGIFDHFAKAAKEQSTQERRLEIYTKIN